MKAFGEVISRAIQGPQKAVAEAKFKGIKNLLGGILPVLIWSRKKAEHMLRL